jgi:FdhE protein
MIDLYRKRIERARHLAAQPGADVPMMKFYTHLLEFQRDVHADFAARESTNLEDLLGHFPALHRLARQHGPQALGQAARELPGSDEARLELLRLCWEGPEAPLEPARFFGRALVQPFAEYLAGRAQTEPRPDAPTCGFCGALPVCGVLRGEGEGGKRSLVCSLCSSEWAFRRILCPSCGCEDKDQLPIMIFEDVPNVRVDACDVCRRYFKSIDLTKDGHAIPQVDDVATVLLAIWAEENGYSRLETNLLGM